MSVSPTGTVRALALSASDLAVLVEHADGSLVIERYMIPDGTLLTSTTVNDHTAPDIDVAGDWIVYHVGRRIRLIDLAGVAHTLVSTAKADATPIDVSIEGRRVAWAQNGRGLHRIRALLAPK
jgi:hypothetical protein